MAVKWNTKKNNLSKMEKTTKSINGKKVRCGVLGGGEQAYIAQIQEYGCKIPITPKMRAWLHRNGLHVKDSTTHITIPERSFIRASWDAESDKVVKKAKKAMPDVLHGNMSEEQYCKMVGLMLSSMMKDYARDLNEPPNHPFTVDRKGSGNPLVDTGSMIGAISYEVE